MENILRHINDNHERDEENMTEYKNYIFDLYGTLVDIHTNEGKISLWKNMASIFSMMGASYSAGELKKQYKKLAGEELTDTLPRVQAKVSRNEISREEIEILLENVFRKLFSNKGIEVDDGQIRQIGIIFRSLSMGYIKLYDGAYELLIRLRKSGKKIYLLSNAQRMFTEPEMKMLGIYDCFDGILYSSDAGIKKPSYYFYDLLFQTYGLKKEESVMIGNEYQADISGAENYGIDSMYIFTEQSGKAPSTLPENCHQIKDISEVYY